MEFFFGDIVIANFNVIVSLILVGFSDFLTNLALLKKKKKEREIIMVILFWVDNIIIGRKGCVSGNFIIGVKVFILLMLLIIVIFVNFN